MADNVAITAGTGTSMAADDIGSVFYPRVKITWGPDGTANDADVATGKPLPIQLRASTGQTLSDTTGLLISTAQLAGVVTTAQVIGAGGQLVTLPTDVSVPVAGIVAHDAADSGNPIKVGMKAIASQHGLTLVAANDRTDLFAGLDGIQLTRPHTNLESIVSGNASNTDGTSTEVLAAGAAGIKHYLSSIILTNMHASSVIYVEIKDGSTVKLTLPCPPGGTVFNPPVPIGGSAATAWNFDPSAATTTIYCSVIGFKSKI